jgi:uncharacterized protein with PIN domain
VLITRRISLIVHLPARHRILVSPVTAAEALARIETGTEAYLKSAVWELIHEANVDVWDFSSQWNVGPASPHEPGAW